MSRRSDPTSARCNRDCALRAGLACPLARLGGGRACAACLASAEMGRPHGPSQPRRAMRITTKRVYAAPETSDGSRLLVDRLWPRGFSKAKAPWDRWFKEIAPSDPLRRRVHGKANLWAEFCQ